MTTQLNVLSFIFQNYESTVENGSVKKFFVIYVNLKKFDEHITNMNCKLVSNCYVLRILAKKYVLELQKSD